MAINLYILASCPQIFSSKDNIYFCPPPSQKRQKMAKNIFPAKNFEQTFGRGYKKLVPMCKSIMNLFLVWSLDIQALSLHVNLSMMLMPTTTMPRYVIGNSTAVKLC